MNIAIRNRMRGQVLVIFGLASVALVGVTALAVDGGRILMDQRALQNAIDGAGLTGASDIGPGAVSSQQGDAEDDTVYALEQALNISFASNYSGVTHRLLGNSCAESPDACSPPFAPTACCTNWQDSTGAYSLTITTPYVYQGNTADQGGFIHVDLVHTLPLFVGGQLWPSLPVHVQMTARNYAVPYAMFMFKHNDKQDFDGNGGATINANKNMGTNGGTNQGTMNFTCSPGNEWGGQPYTISPLSSTTLSGTSTCPGPTSPVRQTLGSYVIVPNLHLPDDLCLLPVAQQPASCGTAPVTVNLTTAGNYLLTPTRPSDPTRAYGPRYKLVTVSGSGTRLYLEPGVYFFEGTASGDGLRVLSSAELVTGECWGKSLPTCNAGTAVCNQAITPASAGGDASFHCGHDMGVLLVFWPSGLLVDPICGAGTYNSKTYCAQNLSSGGYNQFQMQGQGSVYLSSSPQYHNVGIFVDPRHASSAWNFTDTTTLLTVTGCSAQSCARTLGNGSNVMYIQGGGNISVQGATVAVQDNFFYGGGTGGNGFGQILAYTLHFQGNATLDQAYNPLALAYSPVIVQ